MMLISVGSKVTLVVNRAKGKRDWKWIDMRMDCLVFDFKLCLGRLT